MNAIPRRAAGPAARLNKARGNRRRTSAEISECPGDGGVTCGLLIRPNLSPQLICGTPAAAVRVKVGTQGERDELAGWPQRMPEDVSLEREHRMTGVALS